MKKKFRLLHVTHSFGYGGAEVLVKDLLLNHDKNKFDIAACSVLSRIGTRLEEELDENGIPVFYMNKPLGPNLWAMVKLTKLFFKFNPDIIHTHCLGLSYAFFPSLLAQIPVKVHTIHNVPEKETDIVKKMAIKYFGVKPVGLTKKLADNINTYYKIHNTPIIYNGVPIEKYSSCPETRKKYRQHLNIRDNQFAFLHIGRFFNAKNHKLLVESFAQFVRHHPDARLFMVGDGPLRADIESLVNEKNIPNVIFLGLRDDIPNLFNAADAFILSSDWEGLPVVLLEAMAAKKPIISTAVGGVTELIKHNINGILVPPNDSKELCDAMNQLIAEPSFCHQLARNGYKIVQDDYNIKKMTNDYEDFYIYNLLKKEKNL